MLADKEYINYAVQYPIGTNYTIMKRMAARITFYDPNFQFMISGFPILDGRVDSCTIHSDLWRTPISVRSQGAQCLFTKSNLF